MGLNNSTCHTDEQETKHSVIQMMTRLSNIVVSMNISHKNHV